MNMEPAIEGNVSEWKGENWSVVSPQWPGYRGIRHLIIFGDSYSQTSWSAQGTPTEDEPLGVPFPGITYTEGPPNWVGYLAMGRRPPLLVHNYSRGGNKVSGVKQQVTREFVEAHPPSIPWTRRDSIFCTWVGINDLAYSADPEPSMTILFELQQELYKTGARNFLFIDVPPVNRSPAYKSLQGENAESRFFNWNIALEKAIRSFVSKKSNANDPITAIYFSSHKVFTAILNDPESHEFPQEDIQEYGGSIWVDYLHPTSDVHLIVAHELDALLSSIPPFVPPAAEETQHE